MSSASSSSSSAYVRVQLAADFTSCCEVDFTIQFEATNDSLKAHKNFLQIRWKDNPKLLQLVKEKAENNVVTLTEDPVVFKRLFQYFHTADFPDQSSYTDDEIKNIVDLGARYCPEEMSDVTEKLVNKEIFSLKDAYKMLNLSNLFGLSGLKDKASEYIKEYIDGVNRNAETYFASDDFLELDEQCLVDLLKSNDLAFQEVELFEAVVRWGKYRQDSDKDLRTILNLPLSQIRFPLMTDLQLSTTVDNASVLTMQEMNYLFLYVCSDDAKRSTMNNIYYFIDKPRVPVISQQEKDREEDVDPAQNDIDIAYFVLKSESPIPSSSHSTPPESDDHSTSSRDMLFTPNRNSLEINLQAYDLDADTWRKIMAKVEAGEIPKNTTELKCTVNTDYRTRGESEVPPISLPHLEKIVLDLHTPAQGKKKGAAKPNPIPLLRKEFNVDEHLFFKNDKGDDVNIEITVNGCRFFKWTPAEKEVIIGFGEPHSEPFLARLKNKKVMERFNSLTIVNNKLANVMSDNNSSTSVRTFPGSTVKDVMLWGVKDESSLLLGDFLRSFVNLECLHCWTKGPPKEDLEEYSPPREFSMVDIHRDLISGDKLVKLSICQVALVVHPEDRIADIVKANLTELYTDNSHFSPEIYSNFHKIFPKLRKVSFGYNGCTVTKKFLLRQENGNASKRRKMSANQQEKTVQLMTSQTVQLVNNILKIKDIEMIRIAYLEWDLVPENIVAGRNVKAFLKRAGWPARKQDKDVLLTDFLVTKDAKTGEWKLDEAINPDGRRAAEKSKEYKRYWKYMVKLEFQYFGLNRIFKDLKTFEK